MEGCIVLVGSWNQVIIGFNTPFHDSLIVQLGQTLQPSILPIASLSSTTNSLTLPSYFSILLSIFNILWSQQTREQCAMLTIRGVKSISAEWISGRGSNRAAKAVLTWQKSLSRHYGWHLCLMTHPFRHREGASIGISHKLTSPKSRVSQDPIVVETGAGLKRLFRLIFHRRCQSFGLFWAQRGSQQGSASHHHHLKRDFFFIFFFGVMNRGNFA